MSYQVQRDLVGYGANPPDPQWPGGARLALNFVMNYEEGSEYSIGDADGVTDSGLVEFPEFAGDLAASATSRPSRCSNMAVASGSGD